MKRIENKRGDGLILTMVIVFIVLSLCCVISQYFYMYILQQRLEAELQRAVNWIPSQPNASSVHTCIVIWA